MTELLYHTDSYLKEFDAVMRLSGRKRLRLTKPRSIPAAAASPMMWVCWRI